MKFLRSALVLALALSAVQAETPPREVSLVSLLSVPSTYDGARVIVTGYLCKSGTTHPGLFLTRGDCTDANYANAIGLDLRDVKKQLPHLPALLTIEGMFKDRSSHVWVDDPFVWGEIHATNVSGGSLR